MKLSLSIKHLPLGLLCIFLIRSLILNSISLNDVLAFGILAALTAFYELQLEASKLKELNQKIDGFHIYVDTQIKDLKDNDIRQETLLKDTHNVISTMKVASGIRNVR